ncbi:hypothetical protein PIB30_049631 [Stylosanthes scabra]|uniref:C-JID domain-containing protein n=1 Tax=Stylosanthes scabra TaxID=79078 RepID=A0ABU6QH16_9FABA|nr:hypothetical protein [Stylosanthes scabra]
MHDLLRELGRSIVREKSPKEPRKWSRLWNQQDLSHVLRENKTAENLEAIVVQPKLHGIRKKLSAGHVNFSGCPNFLSNELRYLSWYEYPFTCLPSSFQPNKLVKLILSHSNIKKLWKGIKVLHNLTHLELCDSKNLVKIPNLSQAPNLEHLNLKGCVKLVYLDASIGSLQKLRFLNLENCENLVSIPNSIFDLNSLRNLNLCGCWKLFKYQLLEKPRQSQQLNTGQSVQRHMKSSICTTLIRPLHCFSSRRHPNLVGLLLPCLSRFPALTDLNISFCNLVQIPDAIEQLRCLGSLNIGGNNIVKLPDCIKELPKLRRLNLEYCKHLKWLPSTLLPMEGTSRRVKYGGIWRGLYVFNCPNLSDKEGCRVTVISWMIKMIQVNSQGIIEVVTPGSKIPRWFNKQNTGDSVKLDPSPILDNNNWIGIACCATFVVHDAPAQNFKETEMYEYLIYGGFRGNPLGLTLYSTVPIHFKKGLITTELDHVLLMFFFRESFVRLVSFINDGAFNPDKIEFATNVIDLAYSEVVEVKRCGYRWVFKEDLEQLNPTMMFGANSSDQNQKHNFLAVEDASL